MLARGRALLLVVLLSHSLALAQSPTGELRDEPYEHLVHGELGLYYRPAPRELGLVQPGLFGQFTLARFGEGLVQLDVGWRAIGSFGSDSAFRAMNPYLGVRLGHEDRSGDVILRVRGSLGVTAPLTNAYDEFDSVVVPLPAGSPDGATTQYLAESMQGGYDLWLLFPVNTAIVLRGDVELRHQYVVFGADVGLALLVFLPSGDTSARVQLGAFVGGRPIRELTLGLRLQGAGGWPPTLAMIPYVRGELGLGFVEGRLLLYSPSSLDGVGAWAVQLLGGATF